MPTAAITAAAPELACNHRGQDSSAAHLGHGRRVAEVHRAQTPSSRQCSLHRREGARRWRRELGVVCDKHPGSNNCVEGERVRLYGANSSCARARRSRATRCASRPTCSSRLGGASPISFSTVLFRDFPSDVGQPSDPQSDRPAGAACWPPSPLLEFGLGAGAVAAATAAMVLVGGAGTGSASPPPRSKPH